MGRPSALPHRWGLASPGIRWPGLAWLGLLVCMLGLTSLWPRAAWADELQAVPPLSGRVVDTAQGLTSREAQTLSQLLAQIEQQQGAQMAVLIVPTTAPEDIEAYANRVANTWKLGRKDVGDGLIIVVALNDRAVRIEVAKGLEGSVPDVLAGRIIQQDVVPAFRRGDRAEIGRAHV